MGAVIDDGGSILLVDDDEGAGSIPVFGGLVGFLPRGGAAGKEGRDDCEGVERGVEDPVVVGNVVEYGGVLEGLDGVDGTSSMASS